MYLDFEDHRPDAPRVPSAISRREGILLSLIIHMALVIVVLVLPPASATAADERQALIMPPQEPITFVHMEPLIEQPAPPRLAPELSDLDRRSTTPVIPPDAEEPEPFSVGNTPEKMVGAPEEAAIGPDAPPAPPAPPADPNAVLLPGLEVPDRLAGGNLGESLRDLQRYLRDENFDNQRGGLTENAPDIQFDSRGVEFGPWLRRFVAQLKSNWYIPQAALVNRGSVVVEFDVHMNGAITNIKMTRPSRVLGFNTAAVNSVTLSNPTLPLPAEYPLPAAHFTVTFHYNERAPR